jgi:hypothetical protein
MLVRRRCVPLSPVEPLSPNGERADSSPWFEDVGGDAYWGAVDLVFEGP